jgi:serine/threonine protein kinase
VLEKIGEGGMGQVYLAEDTSLERKVPLKFLPVGLQTDPAAHKRFIRKAQSTAALILVFTIKGREKLLRKTQSPILKFYTNVLSEATSRGGCRFI